MATSRTPGISARRRRINRDDAGMRIRTAHIGDMEHARQRDICDVSAATGQQPLGIRARHASGRYRNWDGQVGVSMLTPTPSDA